MMILSKLRFSYKFDFFKDLLLSHDITSLGKTSQFKLELL